MGCIEMVINNEIYEEFLNSKAKGSFRTKPRDR